MSPGTTSKDADQTASDATEINSLRRIVFGHILVPAGFDNAGHPILAIHPTNLPDPLQINYADILAVINDGLEKYMPAFSLIYVENELKYRPPLSTMDGFMQGLNPEYFGGSCEFLQKIVRMGSPGMIGEFWPASTWKPVGCITRRLFGELLEVVQPDGNIPAAIASMIAWLRQYGVHTDGIFRRSADAQTLETIKSFLNASRTLDYNAFHDPNDVACVLKMYVRELPTQLISPALYSHFIDPNNYEDASQAVCLIRETILAKIPAQHLRLLEALFGLFNAISRHEATNRMGAKNLAICWSPNLVYSDSLEEQMRYMKACQATVAFMIENYEQLFLQ